MSLLRIGRNDNVKNIVEGLRQNSTFILVETNCTHNNNQYVVVTDPIIRAKKGEKK